MTSKHMAEMTLAAGAASLIVDNVNAKIDSDAVDKVLQTLKTYDWGADRKTLNPIDEAIVATHGDTAARKQLEKGLVDALAGGLSRSAQDFVCRKLRVIGAAQSVEALAALLPDERTSHIARYALERLPGNAATAALRDALPKVSNTLKPGIIGSLGVRRNRRGVKAIAAFLSDSDIQVAQAAAHALGLIGNSAASKRLSGFAKKAPANMKMPTADACLICAEQLLADGKKSEAIVLYNGLKGNDQPKHIKVAAMKGMLTAAAKK